MSVKDARREPKRWLHCPLYAACVCLLFRAPLGCTMDRTSTSMASGHGPVDADDVGRDFKRQ